jgi:hypothetical protein
MRKSKRELWRAVKKINDTHHPGEITVTSEVVTVTDAEDLEEDVPTEGAKLLETRSPLVTVHRID